MKQPIVLTITNMKDIGGKEQHWSDDQHRYVNRGPSYIRITAEDTTENPQQPSLKLELPAPMAKRFRVGGKITIA